ncbi:MAG: DUF2723 domain-containing protein [Thermoleophilia bacterium]|nr:DUF2723 domain-containing protein [Thermoleophilia bacterium]
MKELLRKPAVISGVILGLASLALYTYTLAPGVLAHDSGEWQAAGATLGISHAPGSPAYIITAWLFSLVPAGSAAARVNFVSAVMGAAGVVAVYALVYIVLGRLVPALVSGISLAAAALWWSHATVANPYNAVPTIIAASLALLMLWRLSGDRRLIWAGALIFGFGLSYHPTLLFFLPVPLAGIFVLGPWRSLINYRTLLVAAGLFMLGLVFYAYLPVRSSMDPDVLYQKIDSFSSFYRYVSAADARAGGAHGIADTPPGEIRDRLVEVVTQSYFPSYAFMVFGPAIILLYSEIRTNLGAVRRPLLFIFGGMLVHVAIVLAVSGVFAQYYMPLLLYFSIWAGFSVYLIMAMGEAYLGRGNLRRLPAVAVCALYLAVLLTGVWQKWDFVNHNRNDLMGRYVDEVLSRAEPGAVVMADWESFTGMLYAQKVDGQRSDIRLISVRTGQWRELLPLLDEENPGAQILLSMTHPYEQEPGVRQLTGVFPLDIKGKTYQDVTHGEPYPARVTLYEVIDRTGL